MKSFGVAVGLITVVSVSTPAAAQEAFPSGSLIVPMDIDHQDTGMLRAFGLVYKLLLSDVPVAWCIMPGKSLYTGAAKNPTNAANAVDFTAGARDVRTGAALGMIGYRGGPFVVDAAYRTQALAIVSAWNTGQANIVNVHEATAAFNAFVDRVLVNAPNIGVNADGNEAIAYGYMNAAGIPDSAGRTWSGTSADVMTPEEIAGPTNTDQRDGALWGASRLPHYCQLMSMHWSVSRDAISNESIAEMSEYLLNYPVHLFAECQAVNQLEDAPAGHFVSTDNGTGTPTKSVACDTNTVPNNGLCAKKPTPTLPLEFLNSHLPFAQLDGPFKTVGGSEPAYGLAPGSSYYDQGIVMIREQNVAGGVNGKSDLWMTGYANFAGSICTIGESGTICRSRGKVSYLGGHQYSIKVPISANGDSQGTRLFLNSLFEAECVTARGAANVAVTARAPAFTATPIVTFSLDWNNVGAGVAVAARLTDTLPAGVAFVSASNGGTFSAGKVTWDLGDLAPGGSGSESVTVSLPSYGSYANNATVTYKVGNNSKTGSSNTTTTIYGAEPPDAGADAGGPDAGGGLCAGVNCPGPMPADPCKVGACNPANGSCGIVDAANGTPCDDGNVCTVGTTCSAGVCGGGAAMQCAQPANPCQRASCVVGSGCVVSNGPNGVACSNGDMCVIGEACSNGICSGGASRACLSSSSPCEVATCDPTTGCGFRPGNDGTACDDGDICTTGTTCSSGLCRGGAGCAQPSAPCTLAVCGALGCQTMLAAAGTDPRGDCPAIGSCMRSCDGTGSCTPCPGTGGTGGGSGSGGGGTGGTGGLTGSGGSAGGATGGATSGGSGAGGIATGGGGTTSGSGGSASGGTTGGGAAGGATGVGGGGVSGTGGNSGSGNGGNTGSMGGSGGSPSSGRGGSTADAGGPDGGGSDATGNNGAAASGCGCDIQPASGATAPLEILLALSLGIGLAMRRRPAANRRRR
jgi:uncharacterized repeat protein (TIGR01451 family)